MRYFAITTLRTMKKSVSDFSKGWKQPKKVKDAVLSKKPSGRKLIPH